jgi:hypothetical protein
MPGIECAKLMFVLLLVATYVLAPVPNALCARCAGGDDLMSDYHRYIQCLRSLNTIYFN